MSKVTTMLLMLFPFCAMAGAQRLGEEQILKIAKAQAANYCARSTVLSYTKVRCNYSANFDGKSWGVIVHSIYQDTKGRQVVLQGADLIYVFSPSGKLLQELHGE